MVKKIFQILLGLGIVGLAYYLIMQVVGPLQFQQEHDRREKAVIEKIVNIRDAQRAYKQVYSKFTDNFDELIRFVLNDSLTYVMSIGSADDSVAVAQGLVRREEFKIAAIDTVFSSLGVKLTPSEVRDLPYVPFANGQKFILNAGELTTGARVTVPVMECKAPYKMFLADLREQELINLIDYRMTIGKYPGIKVGSMDQATNEAGNWE